MAHSKDLERRVRQILGFDDPDSENWSLYKKEFSMEKEGGVVDIEIGAMYSRPELGFKRLKELSELFGSDDIQNEEFGHSGCKTCDFGSRYGWRIRIKNAK